MTGLQDFPLNGSNQRKEALGELRERAFLPLSLGTCLASILLVLVVSDASDQAWKVNLVALTLILTSLVAIFLPGSDHTRGRVLTFSGWTAAACLAVAWFPAFPLAGLLVLPVAYIALFIDRRGGLAACLALSLAAFLIARLLGDQALSLPWIIACLGGWVVLGMAWLLTSALEEIVVWSWQNYAIGRQQLEEAGLRQGELNQVVKDLADANTQLARMNQLLDVERRRAEEAERVKAEFTANVSHELRTPLNMIIGFSEAILNVPATYGTRLPPALLADINAIYRNSQHLTNLINDVLDISQIEARRMNLNRDWYSLEEIVQEAAQAIQPLLESRGLTLENKTLVEIPAIYCDKTRIRQVLLNLLSNAARYTDSGGITIETSLDEKMVTVSVIDTGPGIAEADLPRLFEPFRQLDSHLRRKPGGSGLGLNISKRFIELHEGQMGVSSRSGFGSRFWFSLPLKLEGLHSAGPGRWINPDWEPKLRSSQTPKPVLLPRILILEPDNLLEDTARRYLDDVQIEGVSQPSDVNARLEEQPAQVVIVRAETPEQLSAWTQAIHSSHFQAPMVAFSTPSAKVEDSLGVVDYLLKPVTSRRLVEAVENVAKPVRSILLVDDNLEALQLFTRILSSLAHRYRVLQASSGQEAVDLLRRRQPDLMILDLVMPGMDGYAVLAEKNRDPLLKSIPVIILSATDPSGQPIITSSFNLIRHAGLSIPEFLQCALALSGTLSPVVQNHA